MNRLPNKVNLLALAIQSPLFASVLNNEILTNLISVLNKIPESESPLRDLVNNHGLLKLLRNPLPGQDDVLQFAEAIVSRAPHSIQLECFKQLPANLANLLFRKRLLFLTSYGKGGSGSRLLTWLVQISEH